MKRRLTVIGFGLTGLALAGCSGGSSGPPVQSIPVHSTQSNSAPESSPPPTTSTASSPPAKKTTKAAGSACATAQLSLSLGQAQGAAGTFYTPLVLTNTSSGPCTLYGFPGVSFVGNSGNQLGPSAARRSESAHTVKLAGNGGQASALLQEPDPSAYPPGKCQKATATRLRVYPPGQFTPLSVADRVPVCTTTAGRATIGPVQPGTNPTP